MKYLIIALLFSSCCSPFNTDGSYRRAVQVPQRMFARTIKRQHQIDDCRRIPEAETQAARTGRP